MSTGSNSSGQSSAAPSGQPQAIAERYLGSLKGLPPRTRPAVASAGPPEGQTLGGKAESANLSYMVFEEWRDEVVDGQVGEGGNTICA